MYFAYDANGTPMSIVYSGTVYYYVTNVQGDVIALVDSEGKEVVTYTYDAWGNPLSMDGDLKETLGKDNPLRYRSYVYDQETKLYYLQSRYYNPELGRFINVDNQMEGVGGDVLGYNLFTYCRNNPVNMSDASGHRAKWLENAAKIVAVAAVIVTAVVLVSVATAGTGGLALAAAGVAFGTACGGIVGGIANEKKGESFINGWLGGAANGFIQSVGTVTLKSAGTILGGGIGSGIGTAITESLNNSGKSINQRKSSQAILNSSLKSALIGTAMSVITAGIGYGVDYAQGPNGYNSWANSLSPGAGIAPITPGFGEMMKGFFSCLDDALVYIFSN